MRIKSQLVAIVVETSAMVWEQYREEKRTTNGSGVICTEFNNLVCLWPWTKRVALQGGHQWLIVQEVHADKHLCLCTHLRTDTHTHTSKTKGLCQALAHLFSTHGELRWLAICSLDPCWACRLNLCTKKPSLFYPWRNEHDFHQSVNVWNYQW